MAKSLEAVLCFALASWASGVRRIDHESRENQTDIKSNAHIICPVLAAMHRAGDLNTDANGDVELGDLYDGLKDRLGQGTTLVAFQSYGIVKYDHTQKGIEEVINDCKPPSLCFITRTVTGIINDTTRRWFNLFTMNGKQALEHGISTGIRGGDTNMPPNAVKCNGRYPCRARFDQFFEGVVSNGKFYLEDILQVVCKARQYGDRGGEFAYADSSVLLGWDMSPVPGREWQMKGAMLAMLMTFGRRDSNNVLYLTMDDIKAFFLEGRYPDGWQRKSESHGCLLLGCELPAVDRYNWDFPCPVAYDAPFWQDTGCQVDTGRTCGRGSSCNQGESCVESKCLCSRGTELRTMCYKNGACREPDDDGYSWFGGPRKVFIAEDSTPGNP